MSACWNGMVAFPAGPYLYRPEQAVGHDGGDAGQSEVEAATAPGSRFGKRGWEMIDNCECSGRGCGLRALAKVCSALCSLAIALLWRTR